VKHRTVSIVIVTRNRKLELRRAVQSALAQTIEAEVLVLDDASTDGSAEMIGEDFPRVKVHSSNTPRGIIVQRNLAARMVSGELMVHLDDDAIFSSPSVVEHTVAEFEDPRIAAIAIPLIDMLPTGPVARRLPHQSEHILITNAFTGAAHAILTCVFQKLGGYTEIFEHQGEERDLCIRLLEAGYVVRLGTSAPIHHYPSLIRDLHRMDVLARRNDILFAMLNVPLPFLPIHLIGTIVNGCRFGVHSGRLPWALQGIMLGVRSAIQRRDARRPVRRSTYSLFRRLSRTPVPLDQLLSNVSS
jgi:GT2 family glycosyltransferase